jgi:hypothetical protein
MALWKLSHQVENLFDQLDRLYRVVEFGGLIWCGQRLAIHHVHQLYFY